MTRVSIGMPTYNRAGFLDETIESLLAQDWPDLEILIIDDGSTDETPRVLERWTRRSPNIHVHRQQNSGEPAACNAAWQRATGALFCVVNSDDPQPSRLIRSSVAFLEKQPEIIVSYPDWWMLDQHGRRIHERRLPEYSLVRLIALAENFVGPGAFVRRDRVFPLLPNLRDSRFRYVSDYMTWLRLAELGTFGHLPETVAAWRQHPGCATNVHRVAMMEEFVALFECYFARADLSSDIKALRSTALANARWVAASVPALHSWRRCWHMLAAAWHTPVSDLADRFTTNVERKARRTAGAAQSRVAITAQGALSRMQGLVGRTSPAVHTAPDASFETASARDAAA